MQTNVTHLHSVIEGFTSGFPKIRVGTQDSSQTCFYWVNNLQKRMNNNAYMQFIFLKIII